MSTINFQDSFGSSGIINKLTLGFIATVAATMIGSVGIVAAQSPNDNNNNQVSGSSSIAMNCKEHYKQFGFKNVGQCVSHLNGHGYGYGGSDDNNQGNENGNNSNFSNFHFHNFFSSWWHRLQHDF